MNNLKSIVENTSNIHNSIAEDVFPYGAVLRCAVCDKHLYITAKDCGYHLKHGWTICCGYTMTLERMGAKK